jgi:CRP/FNR family transcriptional regulator, cyclic AMP receptor protein
VFWHYLYGNAVGFAFRLHQACLTATLKTKRLYPIVSGDVRVNSFSATGQQITCRDFPAGAQFGNFAPIDGFSRASDVVALEETPVAAMGLQHLGALPEYRATGDCIRHRRVTWVRDLTKRD